MPYYSFKIHANEEVVLPKYWVTLGEGNNVINAQIDDLDGFKEALYAAHASLLEVNRLDEFDPIDPDPELLSLSGSDTLLLDSHE
jgi:hypothetical protein